MSLDYRNIDITEEIFNSPEYAEYRKERLKVLSKCGVYIIYNKINNKCYIGSSCDIAKRFRQHKSKLRANIHYNKHLQSAWNKYGEENFVFEIREHVSHVDEAICRENVYIRIYKPEYNIIQVNEKREFFHSEETKKKIGESSKGRKWTEEAKIKYRETKKLNGYKHPPEVIAKITEKLKGKVRSAETLKRMSDSQKGHKQSKESILKMIATKKKNNKPVSEKTRKLLSEKSKGRKCTNRKCESAKTWRRVIDTNTNVIYCNIHDAARKNGIKPGTLYKKLMGSFKNNTSLKLLESV